MSAINDDGMMDQIHLSQLTLKNPIPYTLIVIYLTSLEILDFSNNRFIEPQTIPSEFGLLIDLRSLFLFGSHVEGTIPTEMVRNREGQSQVNTPFISLTARLE